MWYFFLIQLRDLHKLCVYVCGIRFAVFVIRRIRIAAILNFKDFNCVVHTIIFCVESVVGHFEISVAQINSLDDHFEFVSA